MELYELVECLHERHVCLHRHIGQEAPALESIVECLTAQLVSVLQSALLQRQGPWAINSLLIFPNDGMVSPAFFSECQRALRGQQGETVPAQSRLVELLLGVGEGGELRVQGAVMMLPDGSERIGTTDHLVVSLGPGACLKIEPPLLRERLADLLLAGSGLEVAIMAPSVVVRWLLNKVKLDGCDLRCWLSSSHLS